MTITNGIVLAISIMITCSCATPNSGADKPAIDASSHTSEPLYRDVAALDSAFFNAFNTRDLSKLKSYLSDDLEFYHDLGGVTDYNQNVQAFEKTFAGDRLLRRELVKGSLEVYPINNYGAIETGIHRFYAIEKGMTEKLSSEAKFLQVWQNKNGQWKITRIVSYGHQENLTEKK